LWKASTRKGYGQIHAGTVIKDAHRVSWELTNGPIPEGLHVLHRCDVRACVNPEHLFLGTNSDNIIDKIAKGRHPHGPGHYATKLTCMDMWLIERAYTLMPVTQQALADIWKVDQVTISRIVRGKQRRNPERRTLCA
jgi:hypothetical protein